MKVLLINPPDKHLVKTFAPDGVTEEMGYYPPTGLLYVASTVKFIYGERFSVRILDTQVERMSYPQIEAFLEEYDPDIIGISCMTFLVIDALKISRIAKKINREVQVCIGGPHPTIYPEEILSQPEIDFIVKGEGEYVFGELLDALDKNKKLDIIHGLGFKKNGQSIINASQNFIQDLDALPFPDRELLPYKKYFSILGKGKEIMTSLLTSRGCPFQCTFCTKKDGPTCRVRSPENVVQEITECYKKGITDFDIIDDTFVIDKKRVLAIADQLIQKNLPITLDVRARVDTIDRTVIQKLAQAGCTRIRFGVESGNPRILKNLKKGITIEQAKQAFRWAKEARMITFAYFMIGSPGETETEIKQSIQLAKQLDPDFVQFLITTPFPATELYREGLKNGILKNDFWREFSVHPTNNFTPQWWTEHFTPAQLEQWQKKAHMSFYYRPKYILRQLFKIRSLTELMRKVRAGLRIYTD